MCNIASFALSKPLHAYITQLSTYMDYLCLLRHVHVCTELSSPVLE